MTQHPDIARQVPPDVRSLCHSLREAGWRAWIVGGCTRDMLLGREVHDWDLATDARPEDVTRVFRRVIPTGIQHGTVTVMLRGQGYEVTTLRGDGTYSDGRHPDRVTFVNDLEEDLARRDFTVNAIAFDPLDDSLTDPFGGCRDLEARVIRAVGTPQDRFQEDGLRILRAARFAATLGFELDPETTRAMADCSSRLLCVSGERVRDELLKTLGASEPSRGLRIMQTTGAFARVLPELLPMVGCEQNHYHAYDVWEHTLRTVDACRPDPILRLAMLLHDVGKPAVRALSDKTGDYTFYHHEEEGAQMAEGMGERLRLSNEQRQRVVHLVRHHLIPYESSWSESAVRRWVQRVGADHVTDVLEMARADALGKGVEVSGTLEGLEHLRQRVEEQRARGMALSVRDLAVNGRDLIGEVGLAPGPVIGRVLDHLLDLVTEDPAHNERERLLEAARSFVQAAETAVRTRPENQSD
jgi:tRNA nucleotidyltransferase (CCA-adding enzyme)